MQRMIFGILVLALIENDATACHFRHRRCSGRASYCQPITNCDPGPGKGGPSKPDLPDLSSLPDPKVEETDVSSKMIKVPSVDEIVKKLNNAGLK
jgi:hypothetical protein